jgi:hypothetical protein
MKASVALAGVVALVAGAGQARGDFTIAFPFGVPPEVQLNGSATHNWSVFLTNAGGQAGSMFHTQKQQVQNGFITTFRFEIQSGQFIAGDGFALVIHNDSDGSGALGAGGSDLGYGGGNIISGLAIEFDTFVFPGEFAGMHVSVQGMDQFGEVRVDDSLSLGHIVLDPDGGDPSLEGRHEGHIEYLPGINGEPGALHVFIDNQLVLSAALDLGDVSSQGAAFDGNGEAWVGFTAGTGLAASEHQIESWAFRGDTGGACVEPGGFVGFWGGCGVGCFEFAGVTVTGSRAMTYDWYKDEVLITDDDGGRIVGLGTPSIVVNDFTIADRGQYRVAVANACATLDGGSFPLGGPPCDSIDFNNDGSLFDPTDIDAFLSVFAEGPCIPETATCNDIDFNNDSSLFDPCDIDSFLVQFSEGPCTLCGV